MPGCTFIFLFIDQEADLGTQVQNETDTVSSVFSESQMSQQGNFQIIHGAVISIFCPVFNDFLPASLRVIDFSLNTTNHAEVFFGNITCGHSEGRTDQITLFDRRAETDFTQVYSSIDSQCKVMPLFLQLCLNRQREQTEKYSQEGDDGRLFHAIIQNQVLSIRNLW